MFGLTVPELAASCSGFTISQPDRLTKWSFHIHHSAKTALRQTQTFVLYEMRVSKKKSASGLTKEFIATCSECTRSPCCLTYS
jgi:hypothetical protein